MDTQSLRFKVTCKGETRRFCLSPSDDFAKFSAVLEDLYGTRSFVVTYKDEEGDVVRLSSQLEFEEAKRILKSSEILKFQVELKDEKKTVQKDNIHEKNRLAAELRRLKERELQRNVAEVKKKQEELLNQQFEAEKARVLKEAEEEKQGLQKLQEERKKLLQVEKQRKEDEEEKKKLQQIEEEREKLLQLEEQRKRSQQDDLKESQKEVAVQAEEELKQSVEVAVQTAEEKTEEDVTSNEENEVQLVPEKEQPAKEQKEVDAHSNTKKDDEDEEELYRRREMTNEEKWKLARDISSLGYEHLAKVVDIVKSISKSREQFAYPEEGEIEIDLDVLDANTQRKLEAYVKTVKKAEKQKQTQKRVTLAEQIEMDKPPVSKITATSRSGKRVELETNDSILMNVFGVRSNQRVKTLQGYGTDSGASFWDDIIDAQTLANKEIVVVDEPQQQPVPLQNSTDEALLAFVIEQSKLDTPQTNAQ